MSERIEKKLQQIAKIEKRIAKWEAAGTAEKLLKRDGNWVNYWLNNNPGKTQQDYLEVFMPSYLKDVNDELRRANRDLEEAKAQLEKIKKQESKKHTEEEILTNMPTVIKEFMEKVIKGWNEYDLYWRSVYEREYKTVNGLKEYREFVKKYGYSAIDLMRMGDEEINKNNTRDAERLVLNLWSRVKEITGEITDAGNLKVTAGNNGYAVINGIIKGTVGNAKVESIEAGGYNIQRWHIRTLVKEF